MSLVESSPETDVSSSSDDEEAKASSTEERRPTGSSDRVLVVEDNVINQRVAIAMLETLGFCVDVVDNGVEAVITATMVPYRAILMDCQIPAMDGYETTKEIRGNQGASRSTPIIAVTSSITEPDRKRYIAAGMDGLIAKPLNLDALAAGIALWAPGPTGLAGGTEGDGSGPLQGHDGAESTVSDKPALDADIVGRLEAMGAASGEDLISQLAVLFLADADVRVMGMREAITHEDGQTLINSAHTMCGASANLGAAELSRLCARLATDGAVWGLDAAETLLQAVETELERVRTALVVALPPWLPAPPLLA
jgi:CheY-like chemotaxis protein